MGGKAPRRRGAPHSMVLDGVPADEFHVLVVVLEVLPEKREIGKDLAPPIADVFSHVLRFKSCALSNVGIASRPLRFELREAIEQVVHSVLICSDQLSRVRVEFREIVPRDPLLSNAYHVFAWFLACNYSVNRRSSGRGLLFYEGTQLRFEAINLLQHVGDSVD